MARTDNLTNFLTDVADSIREKKGTSEPILASNFDTEIDSIATGEPMIVPYAPRHISFINYGGTELDYEINNLDVSNLTTFEEMFSGCRKITNLDLNHWNTSKITNMSGMFSGCPYLENINIENWDTSKVTDMSYMFYSCNNLESLDVSNFDTTNVTDMSYMFSAISNKMTTLDLSSFNTSKVTSMRYMFYWSYPLTNLNISNFDTTNVTSMTYMFNGCRNIKDLDLSSFDASKVTNISYAFNGTTGLENVIFMNNLGKGFTSKSNNSSYYLLNFSEATKLTHDSLMDIINKLYDLNLTYDVANGGTLYTQILMLGATNLAKLTAEEINVATSKGWSVS